MPSKMGSLGIMLATSNHSQHLIVRYKAIENYNGCTARYLLCGHKLLLTTVIDELDWKEKAAKGLQGWVIFSNKGLKVVQKK